MLQKSDGMLGYSKAHLVEGMKRISARRGTTDWSTIRIATMFLLTTAPSKRRI